MRGEAPGGQPPPDHDAESKAGHRFHRRNRQQPGDRDPEAEDVEIHEVAPPEHPDIEALVVGHHHQREHRDQAEDRDHRAPLLCADWRLRRCGGGLSAGLLGRQVVASRKVGGKADHHADAGGGEAIVEAQLLAERAADQGRGDGSEVDRQHEQLEGLVAAHVTGAVEGAQLHRDIALDQAAAEDQRQQRHQERGVEGHHEVARGHGQGADGHGRSPPEPAIPDDPADDRRHVDERRIETEDLRGQRLDRQGPEHPVQRRLQSAHAQHLLDMSGPQHLVHHVEDQQRLHAVVGEPLPRFSEGQISEPGGMPEKSPVARARHARGQRQVHGGRIVHRRSPSIRLPPLGAASAPAVKSNGKPVAYRKARLSFAPRNLPAGSAPRIEADSS